MPPLTVGDGSTIDTNDPLYMPSVTYGNYPNHSSSSTIKFLIDSNSGNITSTGILAIDTINENSANNGVIIEGVTLIDRNLDAHTITANNFAGNGGKIEFYTKVDGGSVTEKLRINNVGAIGIGGANYGNSGQVLVSNGSGSAVSWTTLPVYIPGTGITIDGTTIINNAPDQTVKLTGEGAITVTGTYPDFVITSSNSNTLYTAGTGVSINNSNVISIGQSVNASDSVRFREITCDGSDSAIRFINADVQLGKISFTYDNGGSEMVVFGKHHTNDLLKERLKLSSSGLFTIKTDGVGLLIASEDGITEQAYIFNSSTSATKDLVLDASVGSSAKGIAFRIGGKDKIKIGHYGEIGIGEYNDYGNPGEVLTSNGQGNPVTWSSLNSQRVTLTGAGTTTVSGTYPDFIISSTGGAFYQASTSLYNGAGIYGKARLEFTNGSFSIEGHDYNGYDYVDMFFTYPGFEAGAVTSTGGWQGSQLLILNAGIGRWEIYDFTSGRWEINPTSDDRIKTNEEILTGDTYINYVKQIVPKKYKKYGVILTKEEEELLEAGGDPFADKRSGKPEKDYYYNPKIEYGVIAQDVHKIPGLEDIVSVGDDNNMWSVDYRSLDTITLGAVKGLIDKIENLEATIKTLKERIETLESK